VEGQWSHGRTGVRSDFTTVATADALIVLGHGGGGYGGGQEMAWGVAGRIPIPFVYHQDDPLSRQVRGTPADIAFESFSDAAELGIKVRQFIRDRRKDLYRYVAIRQARTLTYSTPMRLLEERWLAFPPGQRAALPGTPLRRRPTARPLQVGTQLIGIVATIAYSLAGSLLLLWIIDKVIRLRATEDDEMAGLDISQHSESAYSTGDAATGHAERVPA
jgi:hypothetical protein